MLGWDVQGFGMRLNDALIKYQKWTNCTENIRIVEKTVKIKILAQSKIQEMYKKLKLF